MKDSEFLMWLRDRLEFVYDESPLTDFVIRVKNMAHEALVKEASALDAEPAQPVAWMSTYDKQLLQHHPAEYGRDPSEWVPLFAAPQPPADVPLMTDEERTAVITKACLEFEDNKPSYDDAGLLDLIVRAVEAEVRKRCGVEA